MSCHGLAVTTVEGIGSTKKGLHAVQASVPICCKTSLIPISNFLLFYTLVLKLTISKLVIHIEFYSISMVVQHQQTKHLESCVCDSEVILFWSRLENRHACSCMECCIMDFFAANSIFRPST